MAFPFPDTAMTGDCLNCLHVLHIYLHVHQTCTSRWMYNTDGMHTIYDLWSATISPTHRNGTAHTSNMAPGMQCGLHLAHILTFYMASWHSILAYYWTSYLTYRPTIAIWHKFWHEKRHPTWHIFWHILTFYLTLFRHYILNTLWQSPCELSKKGGWRHSIVDRGGLEVEHLKNGAPSSKEWMGQTNIS